MTDIGRHWEKHWKLMGAVALMAALVLGIQIGLPAAAEAAVPNINFTGHTESGDQVWVTWEAVEDASHYELMLRERGNAPFWEGDNSTTVQLDASNIGFTWKSDTDYILRVVARGDSGDRLARGAYVFQFEGDPEPTPAVTTDEGFSDTTAGEIHVIWTGTAKEGADSWVVRWRPVGGNWIDTHEQDIADDDYLITDLTSGTQYVVRIELKWEDGSREKWAVGRFAAP